MSDIEPAVTPPNGPDGRFHVKHAWLGGALTHAWDGLARPCLQGGVMIDHAWQW